MNKQLTAVVSAIAALAILVGCSTVTPSQQAVTDFIIQSAATDATIIEIQSHPEYTPDFVAGEQALAVLAGTTNQLNAASIEAIMVQAGQTNLVSKLLTANLVGLANTYIANAGTNSVAQNAAVKSIANDLAVGIGAGLPQGLVKAAAKLKK